MVLWAGMALGALSRIIYDKYRCIRWGMGVFGVSMFPCAVAAVRALTI